MSGEDVTADFVVVDEVEPVIYDVGSGNSGGDAQHTQSVLGGASGGNIVESVGQTGNVPDELQSPVSVTGARAVVVFQNPSSAHSVGSNSQSANNGDFGLSYNEQYNSPEDSLMRFRNLNEIYENTSEIDLIEDSDVEAMLAIMEEPTYYIEAAGDEN